MTTPTLPPAESVSRGRPRDPRAERAILQATLDITSEHGLVGLTIDVVAQRAGVGKATIYRRWASKEEMVIDAWRTLVTPIEAPNTGSLRGDLEALLAQYTSTTTGSADALPHLIAAARVNPDLQRTLTAFIEERRAPMRATLRQAVKRGEIRSDIDLDLMHEMIVGPMLSKRLLFGEPISKRQLDKIIEFLLRGLAP
jgi:AcrR family transcriptional regulator